MIKTTVKNKRFPIKSYMLLHSILLLYSFCSVFSKMASQQPFLSFPFLAYYGLVLVALMAYAILWQQVLKLLPLTTAFANKAVVMVWGMLWGFFFLGEKITWTMILGAAIVFVGVVLVVSDDK